MGLVSKVVGSQAGENWETQLLATWGNQSHLGWNGKERRSCYWNLGVGSRAMMGQPHGWMAGAMENM